MARDFFVELSDAFTRLVTFPDHVLITGDLNVRLDRVDDPSARQLNDLLATFGMVCHVTLPTHDMGGQLEVVITRADLRSLPADIIEIAISRPSTSLLDGAICAPGASVQNRYLSSVARSGRRCLTRKAAVVPTMSA